MGTSHRLQICPGLRLGGSVSGVGGTPQPPLPKLLHQTTTQVAVSIIGSKNIDNYFLYKVSRFYPWAWRGQREGKTPLFGGGSRKRGRAQSS
jgi:hypothetical protein